MGPAPGLSDQESEFRSGGLGQGQTKFLYFRLSFGFEFEPKKKRKKEKGKRKTKREKQNLKIVQDAENNWKSKTTKTKRGKETKEGESNS